MTPDHEATFTRALEEARLNPDHTIKFELDLATAMSIVSNLQLALRHPENQGENADNCREFINAMIDSLRESGFPATAEILELGDDPAADVHARLVH